MRNVLLLASNYSQHSSLVKAVDEFHRRGCRTTLVTWKDPAGWDGVACHEIHWMTPVVHGYESEYFRATAFLSPEEVHWESLRRDTWVMSRVRQADAIVVLDTGMVYAAWEMARINVQAHVHIGLHATLRALDGPPVSVSGAPVGVPDAPVDSRRAVRRLVARARRGVSRRRRGSAVDANGAAPSSGAVEQAVQQALDHRDDRARIAALAQDLENPLECADYWGALVSADLRAGQMPTWLSKAVRSEFHLSDTLFSQGDMRGAVASFVAATRLMFHPALHLESTASPLVADPEAYVAPLRSSAVGQRLQQQGGRERQAAPAPSDRPTRVLILTNGNENFVGDLIARLRARHDVEVEMIASRELPRPRRLFGKLPRLLLSRVLANGRAQESAETHLRERVEWADVVWVEWCTAIAHYLTLIDPGDTRVLVRLHSYEAWSLWPHLLDYSRVDDMVFVSDHLRELTQAMVPALRDGTTRAHTLPNAIDLQRFVAAKEPDARFTVGMVGHGVVAKDVRWAVQVVTRLRAVDPRYRLKLVGGGFGTPVSPAGSRYRDAAHVELSALDADGGLIRHGRTEDVAGALTDIGIILSSSVREGSPVAVLEGAASGAVPVVRNWPFFASLEHGPHSIYPADWVVETVDEAVDRIVGLSDQEVWQAASQTASETALSSFDLSATQDLYDEIIFGG